MRFQPQEGVKVKLLYQSEQTRVIDGRAPMKVVTETTSEGVFKRSGSGFEDAPLTVASTMSRNGSPVTDPIFALPSKISLTYVISAGGEATSVKGFADVAASLKSAMGPQTAAALAPVVNEAALAGREMAEWNARYAQFAGGRFKIGDVIDTEAPQPLPSGDTLTYTIRTTFPRRGPCPAGQCVRIEDIRTFQMCGKKSWCQV